MAALRQRLDTLKLAAVAGGLVAGGFLFAIGAREAAQGAWGVTIVAAVVPAALSVFGDLLHRRAGVDVVALLALLGTLVVREFLAGAVIALMLVTGRALEARASARARSELKALLERAPTFAHRIANGTMATVPVDSVQRDDVLLVAAGEVIPVDGVVISDAAVLDESALTGESTLVERSAGDPVRSGGVNAGGAFQLRSTATPSESTYAGIVRLVRQAEASRAPLVREADRFALWFVPLTLLIAGAALLMSHDPVRAVAVLVVATPCPLILAAPIALVGGMSRLAHRGAVVKNGAALEMLGRADVLLFDKTGTLTEGRAHLASIATDGTTDADEILQLAASLEQASTHALARPIVNAAREQGLTLYLPEKVTEDAGTGIRGVISGRTVSVGRATYAAGHAPVPAWAGRIRQRTASEGLSNVFVGVDGTLAGAIVLDDPLRPDASRAVQRLRTAGIRRVVLVTGDHPSVAQVVAAAVGVDAVYAESTPSDKVDVVTTERRHGTVIMVGDGINDAPALAAADVGVAMGVRGATASSEAADVVLMVDRIDRLAEAVQIARRTHRIAVQSIVAGMGLSLVAMGFAAFGALIPVVGAVVQEAIDVAVIVNALRAHGGRSAGRPPAEAVVAGQRVLKVHAALRSGTARLQSVADELGMVPPAVARGHLDEIRRFLEDEVIPHEHDEEHVLFPAVAPYAGGDEVLVAARREHAEVARLTGVLTRMIDELPLDGPTPDELTGLRRVLYSLHAVLVLHRRGEEERLTQVVDEPEMADLPSVR